MISSHVGRVLLVGLVHICLIHVGRDRLRSHASISRLAHIENPRCHVRRLVTIRNCVLGYRVVGSQSAVAADASSRTVGFGRERVELLGRRVRGL